MQRFSRSYPRIVDLVGITRHGNDLGMGEKKRPLSLKKRGKQTVIVVHDIEKRSLRPGKGPAKVPQRRLRRVDPLPPNPLSEKRLDSLPNIWSTPVVQDDDLSGNTGLGTQRRKCLFKEDTPIIGQYTDRDIASVHPVWRFHLACIPKATVIERRGFATHAAPSL
jgi:hypothetical protein